MNLVTIEKYSTFLELAQHEGISNSELMRFFDVVFVNGWFVEDWYGQGPTELTIEGDDLYFYYDKWFDINSQTLERQVKHNLGLLKTVIDVKCQIEDNSHIFTIKRYSQFNDYTLTIEDGSFATLVDTTDNIMRYQNSFQVVEILIQSLYLSHMQFH